MNLFSHDFDNYAYSMWYLKNAIMQMAHYRCISAYEEGPLNTCPLSSKEAQSQLRWKCFSSDIGIKFDLFLVEQCLVLFAQCLVIGSSAFDSVFSSWGFFHRTALSRCAYWPVNILAVDWHFDCQAFVGIRYAVRRVENTALKQPLYLTVISVE